MRLAARLIRYPFGLPGALALGGNLFRPTCTHKKTTGKLLQRTQPLVVGKQHFPAQIIPIRSSHSCLAADCRQLQPIALPKML
jgi:hypothetical protein